MKYNLQFFADGEEALTTDELFERIGAEDPAPAEQEETVNEAETEQADNTQGSENATSDDGIDKNAIYAQARRWADTEIKKRQEAEDARFRERCKGLKNPETGKEILTAADYWEAIDAQERIKTKAELESKGVDYSIVENLINNSPRLRQADQLIRDMQQKEVARQIESDIAELNRLDPSITSVETVPQDVFDYSVAKRIPLTDAYKILNFENASAKQAAAIKQGVINQIAGKSHLAPVNGVAKADNLVDIPESALPQWREFYPELSDAELRKKYNRTLNTFK